MEFVVKENSVPVSCKPKSELREALAKLIKGQSLIVPADYVQDSRAKRELVAMSCLRVGGPGAFKVQTQKDGSFEVFKVK